MLCRKDTYFSVQESVSVILSDEDDNKSLKENT